MTATLFILSWDKDLEDALADEVYHSLEAALKAAKSGQYVHKVIGQLNKVVFGEPSAVVMEYR